MISEDILNFMCVDMGLVAPDLVLYIDTLPSRIRARLRVSALQWHGCLGEKPSFQNLISYFLFESNDKTRCKKKVSWELWQAPIQVFQMELLSYQLTTTLSRECTLHAWHQLTTVSDKD